MGKILVIGAIVLLAGLVLAVDDYGMMNGPEDSYATGSTIDDVSTPTIEPPELPASIDDDMPPAPPATPTLISADDENELPPQPPTAPTLNPTVRPGEEMPPLPPEEESNTPASVPASPFESLARWIAVVLKSFSLT